MKSQILFLVVLCSAAIVLAQEINQDQITELDLQNSDVAVGEDDGSLTREKRTLFLKKKILGAGALGFGLGLGVGAVKGYKYGNRGYGGYGGYGGNGGYGGYGSHSGYGGYGGGYGGYGGGYGGYGGGYGGYNGYSRPSYSNYYTNSYPNYVQRPAYYQRQNYNNGYPSSSGWNGGYNSYAKSNANSWSATGNLGPISAGISASHASANANAGLGLSGGQGYNDGGYYY